MRKKQTAELNRLTPEAFKRQSKTPIVLVLDNIRSGLNVGSAFRTADAFALEGIYLCGITAKPPHREILKTAIGATDSVAWKHVEHTTAALSALRQMGYDIYLVEQTHNSIPLQDFTWQADKPLALVFGNEVKGVSEEALSLADGALEIPQYGTKHSLNVSVCIGMVVWHCFARWKF